MCASRKKSKKIARILFAVIVCVIFAIAFLHWLSQPADYETRDVAEYGHYVGNSEQFMNTYITRFFPETISEDFKDVHYVFHSRSVDEYGFEAYLEFTFDDIEKFHAHVLSATAGLVSGTFPFDSTYQEYILIDEDTAFLYDHIQLGREYSSADRAEPYYQIHYAKIAKILVNYDELRVIYVAMAVHDGGGSDTALFGTYFDRFGIEPKEYEAYVQKEYGSKKRNPPA